MQFCEETELVHGIARDPMNDFSKDAREPAERVLRNGTVITLDARSTLASSIAIRGDRIAAVGGDADTGPLIGPHTTVTDLRGRTVMPGLIDGHAHMDREGLKKVLPSLGGVRSIKGLIERLREIASRVPAGQWVVTMPLGDPPSYIGAAELFEEGRLPNRHDLDMASAEHPILVRSAWGYWSRTLPLVCIANSRALRLAGIDRNTISPSPKVQIERDHGGEPTGVFLESDHMPIAEFTLFRTAPNFTFDQRVAALAESMRLYNAAGTTSVFEGHGVAPQLMTAYQRLHDTGRATTRAHLVFSPGWSRLSPQDLKSVVASWGTWLAGRGLGSDWLRVGGIYTEIDDAPEGRLRARCAPQTGWAGFSYDAGLPRAAVKDLMLESARLGIRVCGIWADLLELYAEVDRIVPIAGQRWVLGHQSILGATDIALIRDLGIVITAHTNAHIHHRASEFLAKVGRERENEICPLRSLLDAGVPVSLCTDNMPISMFHPIWESVERIDRKTGSVIAPMQKISREQALRCATTNGAYLCFEEDQKGTLEPGKLADLIVLEGNPLTEEAARLKDMAPDLTLVGGRVTHERSGPA